MKNSEFLRILAFILTVTVVGPLQVSEAGKDKVNPQSNNTMLPSGERTISRYALVIGLSNYVDNRIIDLPACVNDAVAFHRLLIDPSVGMFDPKNAIQLLDEKVTRRNIVDALENLSNMSGGDDLVIVFFSGHGGIDSKDRSYWIMHDANIDRLRSTALSETEITELLGEIKTRRLLVLIDACYSASTAELKRSKSLLDIDKIYPKFTGDGRVAITASKGDQLSVVISDPSHPGYNYSAFTWYLLEALRGKGDSDKNGVVTVTEVWNYLKDPVKATARSQGRIQEPQLKGQLGSKYLLSINKGNLFRARQGIEEAQKRKNTHLMKLQSLYYNEKLNRKLYNLGFSLIETESSKLQLLDKQKLVAFVEVLEGRLEPGNLQKELEAIEKRNTDVIPSISSAPIATKKTGDNMEEIPEDTLQFIFSTPTAAILTIADESHSLSEDLRINLPEGDHIFALRIEGERDTIYGKLKVLVVNDDTQMFQFGRSPTIFKQEHIQAALDGKPVRYNMHVDSTVGRIVAASYTMGLRDIK